MSLHIDNGAFSSQAVAIYSRCGGPLLAPSEQIYIGVHPKQYGVMFRMTSPSKQATSRGQQGISMRAANEKTASLKVE